MKTKVIITILFLLAGAGPAGAGIVELDLFDLGCPTEFNRDNPEWQTDFDLGVTFISIDHVYIDWSGVITAGLAVHNDNPGEPYPLNVAIGSSLGSNPYIRSADFWGGGGTYPSPEPFEMLSEFELIGPSVWSDILDGKGSINMVYLELFIISGNYVEGGQISLDKAVLIFDGTIIPEPLTIILLGMGTIVIIARKHRK